VAAGPQSDSSLPAVTIPFLDFLFHRGNLCLEAHPVSDIPFHQTPIDRDFFDRNLPELVRQTFLLNELVERPLARLDAEREGR
jgi:hypothetical protein